MPIQATGGGSTKLFMRVNGLKGESAHKKWKDQNFTDIDSFSLSAGASWDFTQGKSTSGSVSFSGVSVTRPLVGATPVLFIGTLKEQQTDKVEIVLANETGGDPHLTIELSGEVRLVADSISGATGGNLYEQLVWTSQKLLIKRGDISSDIDFNDVAGKNDKLSM